MAWTGPRPTPAACWCLCILVSLSYLLFFTTSFQVAAPNLVTERSARVKANIRNNHARPMILLWTTVWQEVPSQNELLEIQCENSKIACDITTDRTTIDEAAALVFHARDVSYRDMPAEKFEGQPWILWNHEAPGNSPRPVYEQGGLLFDLELSYRRNAALFSPYGHIVERTDRQAAEDRLDLEKLFRQQRGAAWLVSNCRTESRREDYVQQLKVHFPVDVYGYCGDRQCPRTSNDSCMNDLSRRYMFYLAFENSICPDYVTEKLFRTLRYPIIPVVMSGDKPESLERLHAYVDASNLDPASLASRLEAISKNFTQYAEFFRWKTKYSVRDQWHPLCNVCDHLLEFPEPLQQRPQPDHLMRLMDHGSCRWWNAATRSFESVRP